MFTHLFRSGSNEIFCPACGRRIGATDRFCANCAHRLLPQEGGESVTSSDASVGTGSKRKYTKRTTSSPGPVWEQVRALAGQTLHTLRGKAFDIESVRDDYVTVIPRSTGKPRPIRRQEIEKGYTFATATERAVTSSDLRAAGASEVNPVYVLSILKAIGALGCSRPGDD